MRAKAKATALVAALVLSVSCSRCKPDRVPKSSSREAPEKPERVAIPASFGVPLELSGRTGTDTTTACGEGCSLKEMVSSGVSLGMLGDLTAHAIDSGAVTTAQTTSTTVYYTTRTWTYDFSGTWRLDGERRLVNLVPDASSCVESSGMAGAGEAVGDDARPCPKEVRTLHLVCLKGPRMTEDGTSMDGAPAWYCGAGKPVDHPGTPLPWVLQ